MGYEIIGRIEEMRRGGNTIKENAEIIQREVLRVDELLQPLRSSFLGNRAKDFFQKYDQAKVDMDAWDEIVLSFADELLEAARRLEAADNV